MSTEAGSGASALLHALISPQVNSCSFQPAIRKLHGLFEIYCTTSPEPLPAPGLFITPEIRAQCERYLPLAEIAPVFKRLYSSALAHPPIFSSSPFHMAMSWADVLSLLPHQLQCSPNPGQFLEKLLGNHELLIEFLFASFLPARFYGSSSRYPSQQQFIRKWLDTREKRTLRCLDAACGIGYDSYWLAHLLLERNYAGTDVMIEGWTVEPLEVWSATNRRLPHDRRGELRLQKAAASVLYAGYSESIAFFCRDILRQPADNDRNGSFDLVICNGLLGGPIIHSPIQLEQAVSRLSKLLAPGGILLAANNFHGGWKQKCPQDQLRAFFGKHGLAGLEIPDGCVGLKTDQ